MQICEATYAGALSFQRPVPGLLAVKGAPARLPNAREQFRAFRWMIALDPQSLRGGEMAHEPMVAPILEDGTGLTRRTIQLALLGIDDLAERVSDSRGNVEPQSGLERDAILDAIEMLSARSGRSDDESRRLFKSVLRTLREFWASLKDRSGVNRTLSLLIVSVKASLNARARAIRGLGATLRAVLSQFSAVLMLTAPNPPTTDPIANSSATGLAAN